MNAGVPKRTDGRRGSGADWFSDPEGNETLMILLIIVLVLLFGGGGGYYYGRGNGWSTPHYGGGLLGLVLVICLILWLTGNIGAAPMLR
jgi:hypothetical protein